MRGGAASALLATRVRARARRPATTSSAVPRPPSSTLARTGSAATVRTVGDYADEGAGDARPRNDECVRGRASRPPTRAPRRRARRERCPGPPGGTSLGAPEGASTECELEDARPPIAVDRAPRRPALPAARACTTDVLGVHQTVRPRSVGVHDAVGGEADTEQHEGAGEVQEVVGGVQREDVQRRSDEEEADDAEQQVDRSDDDVHGLGGTADAGRR